MTETEQRYARYMLQCEDAELPLIMAAKAKGGRRTVKPEMIEAILKALDKGLRVELLKDKDGNIKAQTISRKLLK
uniref:Uncharacterized protein n=1 Tax=Siphoviridae sp. ctvok7 TaxID=2827596 RepID=A0A8S5LLW8_9CAUD|nr:MAG TPA: hypothetical protein [Siphoviridae sp. ctvok7]